METCGEKPYLLTVTENGFGKRTEYEEYKVQGRRGKGILNYRITAKTGEIAGVMMVSDNDDIMLITSEGTIIRTSAESVSVLSRATQGVTLMKLAEGVIVVSIASIVKEEESENGDEGGDEGGTEGAAEIPADGEATEITIVEPDKLNSDD
jgi:DNA gyrase subunit A